MLACKLAPCYGVCWEWGGAPHCSVEMEGTGSSSLGSIEHEALEKGRKSTVGSGSARGRKLEELGWRLGWHSHASGRHLTVCSLCGFQAPMGLETST